MKIFIIPLLMLIILTFWVGKLRVQMSPFSIKMDGWMELLAIVFLSTSIVLFTKDAYSKGVRAGIDMVIELLEKHKND